MPQLKYNCEENTHEPYIPHTVPPHPTRCFEASKGRLKKKLEEDRKTLVKGPEGELERLED